MNDSVPSLPLTAPRLGAAHFAVAALVAAGMADATLWLAGNGDAERLARASPADYVALAVGLGYLLCSVIGTAAAGRHLRTAGQIVKGDARLAAVAHALVLGTAGYIIARGSESPAMFVGLDRLVSTLAVAAALGLGLTLVALVDRKRPANTAKASWTSLLLFASAIATTAAFLWVESLNVWSVE